MSPTGITLEVVKNGQWFAPFTIGKERRWDEAAGLPLDVVA